MNAMLRNLARVLAISAAFYGIQASAQQVTPGPGQTPPTATDRAAATRNVDFDKVDANKDGGIDKSEASVVPGLLAAFDRADADRDGKLNRAEFRTAEAQMKRS